MTTDREVFRFCACCPSPCRSAIPPDGIPQTQTVTPSSLSQIALAVADGQLPRDEATRAALMRTEAARHCANACPFGHDIAEAVTTFVLATWPTNFPAVEDA